MKLFLEQRMDRYLAVAGEGTKLKKVGTLFLTTSVGNNVACRETQWQRGMCMPILPNALQSEGCPKGHKKGWMGESGTQDCRAHGHIPAEP